MEHVAGCLHVQVFELNKPIRCLFAVAQIPELKKSGLWFINTPWISQDKRYYVNRIISIIALQRSRSHYLLMLNKRIYLEKPKR